MIPGLVLTLPTLALGAVLAVGAHTTPAPQTLAFGSCQQASADPLSVCYDRTYAEHQALAQQTRTALLSRIHGCSPTADFIPAGALMRDPAGNITYQPFKTAWASAHHGSWTLAECAR